VPSGDQTNTFVDTPTQTLAALLLGPLTGGDAVEGIFHPGVPTVVTSSTDMGTPSVAGVNPVVTDSIGGQTSPAKSYCYIGSAYTLVCVGGPPWASH
jgi:hypothetical protein